MTNSKYSTVIIIYNPNSSSGQAAVKAERLRNRLNKRDFSVIKVIATAHAGHAEELAYREAKLHAHAIIISVSGDGGYNEVINGAKRADTETGHHTVCAILAAGNANDHRRSVRKQPLSRAVLKATPEAVDILKLTATYGDTTFVRYAHSYIGLGVTSHAAAELNQSRLTRVKEISIVVRTLFNFMPVRVKFKGERERKYDSIIFANIHQMSKVIRIGKKTNLKNGLFKIVVIPHQTRLKLIYRVMKIAIFGVRKPIQREAVTFTLPVSELVHFDGEVHTLPGGAKVTVESERGGLLTVR